MGTTGELYADTRCHVSSVFTLDFFTCAPSSYRAIFFWGFSDLSRAPCPRTLDIFSRINKIKCEKTTTNNKVSLTVISRKIRQLSKPLEGKAVKEGVQDVTHSNRRGRILLSNLYQIDHRVIDAPNNANTYRQKKNIVIVTI